MNGTAEMYSNNSIVTRTDIGTDCAALLCTTTSSGCCSNVNNQTGWYFPSGKAVPYHGGMWATKPYYRTRNNPDISKVHRSLRSVKLHRNPNGKTTGIFRCDILDGSRNLQSLYIGIYDSDTGESGSYTELEVGYFKRRYLALQTMAVHVKYLIIPFKCQTVLIQYFYNWVICNNCA